MITITVCTAHSDTQGFQTHVDIPGSAGQENIETQSNENRKQEEKNKYKLTPHYQQLLQG